MDYIIIKRRHLKYTTDAEANDMIYSSDHRCVMATFVFTTPEKDGRRALKKTSSREQKMTDGIKLTKNW